MKEVDKERTILAEPEEWAISLAGIRMIFLLVIKCPSSKVISVSPINLKRFSNLIKKRVSQKKWKSKDKRKEKNHLRNLLSLSFSMKIMRPKWKLTANNYLLTMMRQTQSSRNTSSSQNLSTLWSTFATKSQIKPKL